MNTKAKNTRRRDPQAAATPQQTVSEEFQEMQDPLSVVEHLTIPGFIRRAPHRFHLDEIMRFGDKVGRIAESLQVSYLTTIDRSLGQIRLFPVPLLTRVYQVMATQFGWEQIVEVPTIEDRKQDLARMTERAGKQLRAVADRIEDPELAQAMTRVLQFLENETVRVQSSEEAAPSPSAAPTPPPLRSI